MPAQWPGLQRSRKVEFQQLANDSGRLQGKLPDSGQVSRKAYQGQLHGKNS